MRISFIITTYNIESYIKQCLDSLRDCVQGGDQIIIIDDGSTDSTPDIIRDEIATNNFGEDIEVKEVFLGVNTIGGVGIAGNIGIDLASREAIFFVDGDDFIDVEGFNRARTTFESSSSDIMLCNYMEYDEKNGAQKHPADDQKWNNINHQWDIEHRRLKALDLIAVPWRKFYLSEILKAGIRFPEGDFFFEDNPFHWRVCRAANSITFFNETICHHRVNRPGQTMTSTGSELQAFFTHFETIFFEIPERDDSHRNLACRWLLNNMSWHLNKLKPEARWGYAKAASKTLSLIPDPIWSGELQEFFVSKNIWPIAERLRVGEVWDVVESMAAKQRHEEIRTSLKRIHDDLSNLRNAHRHSANDSKKARELLQARQYIDEFEALLSIEATARDASNSGAPDKVRSAVG